MRLAKWTAASRRAALWTVVCTLGLVLSSTSPVLGGGAATTLNFGDTHELGSLVTGLPGADSDHLTYVNRLAHMGVGTSNAADGQTYTRSGNEFGHLANALLDGLVSGTGNSVNLGAGGVYSYLFAKYDGPSDGAWVWYVRDQAGTITMPSLHGGNGLSGWTLFVEDPIQPDGRIRRLGGPLRGDDVYNGDGSGQSVLLKMYAGDQRVAYITIQNDGADPDSFTVAADAGSVTGFNIAYHIGRTSSDVTAAVEAGTFTTPELGPGATYRLRINAGVTTSTPRGSSIERLVTITSDGDGTTSDTVGFVVKRK
jgi:hypothetical protein